MPISASTSDTHLQTLLISAFGLHLVIHHHCLPSKTSLLSGLCRSAEKGKSQILSPADCCFHQCCVLDQRGVAPLVYIFGKCRTWKSCPTMVCVSFWLVETGATVAMTHPSVLQIDYGLQCTAQTLGCCPSPTRHTELPIAGVQVPTKCSMNTFRRLDPQTGRQVRRQAPA